MSQALSGVRVLEVAAWTFVPAAGAVLADWGADVIKVEHPETGDPQRGLVSMGLIPGGPNAVNYIMEQPNRGKRSIGIDIGTEAGLDILYQLAESSDVFLTSFLPAVRQRLRIDVEHIRAVNPRIVYARGSGQGPLGEDRERPGYDGSVYWGRGGVANALTPSDSKFPIGGRAAFGDLAGGMAIAGGIAAGLVQLARTGEAPIVDVSLLGLAMWQLSPDIVASGLYGGDPMPKFGRSASPNPLVGSYRTSDDRFITLMMLQSDRYWSEFCTLVGRPDLITDERYADGGSRFANREECIRTFDELFASKTYEEWKAILANLSGAWAPVQMASELVDDPMVAANGYLARVDRDDGQSYDLVANPVQMDEKADRLVAAPGHGQHTDEILLELGLDWDAIIACKESGAVL
ncbi:MAG: CoA transferase [Acidimicrobiales bacterium]|jgi:crotonobetainyl-CoA:carnitine CoA-transferase CaiB-like acyl-CoA transferase